MKKNTIVYILVLLSTTGFTQTETYPCLSTFDTLYQSYTLYTSRETNWQSLSDKNGSLFTKEFAENKVIISQHFMTCLQSWICSSILFPDDNLGYYLTFGRLCLDQFPELVDPLQSRFDLQSSYGIKYRLTGNEDSPSKNLLHYEKPVFDISILHKDEVIEELLKQLRLQEYDFSGLVQDFYRPSTMPGID